MLSQHAERAPDWAATLLVTLGLGGVIAVIAFVFVERRVEHPIVPFSLFRSPAFTGANLLTLFLYAALSEILL